MKPPSALDFPVNEEDSIYETIAAAYSMTNLVTVEGATDPGEKYGKVRDEGPPHFPDWLMMNVV